MLMETDDLRGARVGPALDKSATLIKRGERGGACPLSYAQERLWFLDQLAPGSPVYNIVDVIRLDGKYDAKAMGRTMKELVRRHEILRTAFSSSNGRPMQIVSPTVDLVLSEVDLSSLLEQEREDKWNRVVRGEGRKPFNLSQVPLLRGTMVHLTQQEHRLLLTIHHMIADEWSMEVIQQEVNHLYEAFSQGRPSSLPELPIQYGDFACWQRDWLQGEVLQKQISYWKEELAGASFVLELPCDKPRPAIQNFRGGTEIFELPKELLERLKSLGREEQATLFMILEASFMALLHRYTGQDDILVGTPISGRTHSETESLIGLFLNSVVLRARFTDHLSFRSLLQQVRERALGAYDHPDLPFEHLVAELAPERDVSRTPLFQVMFVLHNPEGVSQVSKVSGNRQLETGTSKFDLTLFISETENGLEGLIEYSTDLFEAQTIRRLCGHYGALLGAIARDPGQSISTMSMLTDAERQQVLVDWNNTAVAYPGKDLCLHQLIEEQAGRTPDQVAVVYEQQTLTYGELDRRANQLANHLRKLGVGPDVLVGLFVERSLEMVVGILGILKAGAAYVPIDTVFPEERIAFVLTDATVTLLLTQTSLLANLPSDAAQVVCLDSFDWTDSEGAVLNDTDFHAGNLAYVIYTSGSTGRPKGVCIEHRNIVNYVLGIAERFQLKPGMTYATVSTIAADLGNTVVFPALATGGCLHIISQGRAENQAMLSDYFNRQPIDILKIVPSHLAALQTARQPEQVIPRRRLILGGESSRLDWIERLRVLAPNCDIYNHYGPTETTVGVLTYRVSSQLPLTLSDTLPLGRPLPNSRIYILDANAQPLPLGIPGELCIGGFGVARGYLNRPDLTTERFVPDPFSQDQGGRLYRTGDRARYLPDGNIEFCGRIDQQVKIHGYRIELGEIEGVLREQQGVRDAVVLASEDESGGKQLVAYVVPKRANQALWENKAVYILPDGSPVAHLNKNETDYIYNELFVAQAYLRHGITIHEGDCIVDAGANIGLFTVFVSRLAQDLRIFAFEPNPAAFACLKANAEAYGTSVNCFFFGLSRENKSAEMTFFEGMSLLSGFYADAATEREVVRAYVSNQQPESSDSERFAGEVSRLIDDRFRAKTESAQLRTLSSVMAEQGIDRIDLLKVNVEKSEHDVLLGLSPGDWLKIRQLVIEVDQGENLNPIIVLLERYGYEVLVEQDPLLRKTELCYVYAIRPSAAGPNLVRQQPADAHARPLSSAGEEILTPTSLRKYLKERLPRYMIPTAFILMEKFPLTSNGKINRKALPALSYDNIQPPQEFLRPRTETEKALAAIWTEVLKVEKISVNDSFFDMGGESLAAIQAVSRIRDAFDVNLPIQALFDTPTISALANTLAKVLGPSGNVRRIERRKEGETCPLSFAQEQLWFLDQLAPGSPVYNIVDVIRLDGKYDAKAMGRTMKELVRRHEILRTAFSSSNGRPMQIVSPTVDLVLSEVDLSSLLEQEREDKWNRVVRGEGRKPFNLSQVPLLRGTMVHLTQQEHRLLLTIHHMIADEWSMEVIQQEVNHLYEAFSQGRPSSLPELPIQYGDFACWQRDWLQGEVLQKQISYWKEELAGASFVLELPCDKPRPAIQNFRGGTEIFELPKELLERLKSLGREEQATLFMILEASFMALLHRYTGQDDILVGTPISGRTHSETESLIGLFLNSVVLRARFTDHLSFRSLLQQVRERALGAYDHPDLPFEHLVAELAPERDVSRTPLFQVMFVLHNPEGVSQVSKVSGNRQLETGTSKFDLTLFISETENGLEGLIEYSTDLFEAQTIRRLCGHYGALLGAIARDPGQSISTMSMLTDAERQQVLVDWNNTAVAYPGKDLCLHQLIEAQTERTPDAVAILVAQEHLTFHELNERANRLAHYLQERGAGPDAPVGIWMDRSLDLVVGLLGVLKVGAAYLPMDPAYPTERLAFMLEDSGVKLLLAQRKLVEQLPEHDGEVICIDADWDEIATRSGKDPRKDVSPDNLAYLLYTSGSTGKPKGVEIRHRAVVNFLNSMRVAPGMEVQDTLLSVTTLSFDIFGLEIWLPLTTGAKVVIVPPEVVKDGRELAAAMQRCGATVMQATPSTWRLLLESGWEGNPNLKILCGGEAWSTQLAEQLLPKCASLWNMYGPTETTIWSAVCRVGNVKPILIGRPIANTKFYVVDAHLQPVPVGVPGELLIGGEGLARGYFHRPELTAEKFIADPFSPHAESRLYRTGDLVRYLPDGNLEFLGRMDQQVKIRGFRIELGEIESALRSHSGVREAVALVWKKGEEGEKGLAAYVVPAGDSACTTAELQDYLKRKLPEYMVPATWVVLPALPLTPNGKVDRKALPLPGAVPELSSAYVAPDSETEQKIAAIWQDVLGIAKVGRTNNFFDLGGHSLLLLRVHNQLRLAFNKDITMVDMFRCTTVQALAHHLAGQSDSSLSGKVQARGEVRKDAIRRHRQLRLHVANELLKESSERGSGT